MWVAPEQTAGYPALSSLSAVQPAAVDPIPKRSINSMHKKVKQKLKLRQLQKLGNSTQDLPLLPSNPLGSEVAEILSSFGREQFVFGSDSSFPPVQPGFIDLFSGKKGFARASARLGAPWVLCIDILFGPQCDLLQSSVRQKIGLLLRSGACKCLSAAPDLRFLFTSHNPCSKKCRVS